jgi:hypothetical protein
VMEAGGASVDPTDVGDEGFTRRRPGQQGIEAAAEQH